VLSSALSIARWDMAVATVVVIPVATLVVLVWTVASRNVTRFLGDVMTGAIVGFMILLLLAEELSQELDRILKLLASESDQLLGIRDALLVVLLPGSILLGFVLLTLLSGALRKFAPRTSRWVRGAIVTVFAVVALALWAGLNPERPHLILAVLMACWSIAIVVSASMLAFGWRALPAWPRLFSGRLDPDEAVQFVAEQLGTDPERPVGDSRPDWLSRRLAHAFFSSRLLNGFISEIAEANRPPFFKSFLRLDVEAGRLIVTCYGVTGFWEDEHSPTVEDRVEIPLPVVVGELPPGDADDASSPTVESRARRFPSAGDRPPRAVR